MPARPYGSVSGTVLRREREAAGIDYREVAKRMGVSRQRVYAIETRSAHYRETRYKVTELVAAAYRFALAQAIAHRDGRGDEFERWKQTVKEDEARRPVRGVDLEIARGRKRVSPKALVEALNCTPGDLYQIERQDAVPPDEVEWYLAGVSKALMLKGVAGR